MWLGLGYSQVVDISDSTVTTDGNMYPRYLSPPLSAPWPLLHHSLDMGEEVDSNRLGSPWTLDRICHTSLLPLVVGHLLGRKT